MKVNNLFLTLVLFVFFSCQEENKEAKKPNVLLIYTDQQNLNAMSAAGNPYLNTPNMDRIANNGVLFKKSYCTSPVCGPARSSMITGLMPHQTGVEWNGDSLRQGVKTVGEIFRNNGYKTVWGGKWHMPESYPQRAGAKQKSVRGFDLLQFLNPETENWMLGAETDPPLTEAAVNFLNEYDQEDPFLMVVNYHNPHDICFYPRKDGWVSENDSLLEIRHYGFEYKLPDIIGTHPDSFSNLPPLPANYEINEDEPEFITVKRNEHNEYGVETKLANQEFTEKEWRGYLNAYYRLTEMVDIEIGKVLDALEANGMDENTIIVFTSDHGDGAAAHKWSAKLSLYEESATVPLLISWPENIRKGLIDDTHLVSQIDVVPTLVDYAGINTNSTFTGKSMRPILENQSNPWREYIVTQLADFKPNKSRKGRMVRSADYKYNVYTHGERNEQLFLISEDPGETKNLINEPSYQAVVKKHRDYLKHWAKETGDNFSIGAPIEIH
jgi:arylsulfatase A-like enzyme